jgi:hypothetical protein
VPDNAANLDAAPAVTAPEPEPEPAARRRPAGGTGDTQSFDAYRRFVGEAMNWISEATGFLHDDVLRTDDARDIITDACSRCWDAFDRIAYPTIHGAAPAARASVGRPRTDNADLPTRAGTGDTPVAESATTAITDAERQAVAVFAEIAWTSLEWSEVQRHANTLRGLLERIG